MAEQYGDRKELERDRDPVDEEVIGRATDEEFEDSDEEMDEEESEDEI